MADNTQLSAPIGSGDTVRDLADGSGVKWPACVVCYATTISAGANVLQEVTPTTGMPIVPASGATFAVTGTFFQATQPVSAASLPLPSGAATAANQSTEIAGLASIDARLAGTIAVSGTFWQATQPVSLASVPSHDVTNAGTFAVQAAQSGVWNITNISGTVSLPTGASTEATLSALNGKVTACNTGAVTISAALPAGTNAIGKLAANSGVTIGAVEFAAGQTAAVTNAGTFAVQATLAAETTKVIGTVNQGTSPWVVSLASTTITGTVAATQSGTWNVGTVTTVTTCSTVTSLSQFAGNAIDTNSGNKSAGTLRVVLATDQPALTNKLLVTPDANSAVNVSQINGVTPLMGNGATGTGALRVSIANDSTGVVQPGNTANTTPWLFTQTPATSGGLSVSRVIDFSGANQGQTSIKGSAGQVFGWVLTNTNAAVRYIKIYNASAPTSASTPILTLAVPGNAAGAGMVAVELTNGIAFGTAIGMRATTGYADNDANAVAAGEVIANVFYK